MNPAINRPPRLGGGRQLRRRAERRLVASSRGISKLSVGEVQKLVHELQVHQIELEMQNEELGRSQFNLQASLDRFADLYDFAPVGYMTLDDSGVIQEINLTAAVLLGVNRQFLQSKKFTSFIAPGSRKAFGLPAELAQTDGASQSCELELRRQDGTILVAALKSSLLPGGSGQPARYLVSLTDITASRQHQKAELQDVSSLPQENPIPSLRITRAGALDYANHAGEPLLEHWKCRVGGQVPAECLALVSDALEEGKVATREIEILGKAYQCTLAPFPERDYVNLYALDISPLKLAEAKLKRTVSLLRATLESTADGLLVVDLSQTITGFNQRFAQMWQIPEKLLAARDDAKVVEFATRQLKQPREFLAKVRQLYEKPEQDSIDLLSFKDGRLFERYSHPQWLDGRPVGRVWSFRDVTAKHRAELEVLGARDNLEKRVRQRTAELEASNLALSQSEQELNDFFDASPVGLLLVGSSGRILRANQEQLELLDRTTGEVLNQPVRNVHADKDAIEDLLKLLAKGGKVRNYRVRIRHKNGDIKHVLIDANGRWENRRLVHSRWFVRDITRRVELEREILAVSEREQQRIGQDLHDDLCQQLAGVEFRIESLVRELAKADKPRAAQGREIARLARQAMNQTREMARGLFPVPMEEEGLMGALQELAARIQHVFRRKCRFLCAEPVRVPEHAVGVHLYRIAQEAVSNAIKHGKARSIDITLAARGGNVLLCVSDDGVGLPRKLSLKQRGMGLRLMKYRVGVIGGSFVVQSPPTGGTEVVCSVRNGLLPPEARNVK